MSENEILLPAKSVEAFLKRERDEHGKESYWWRSLDEALDAFRLHMVTGTPLTEPRPHGGPEAFGVGKEPLTEAEELRAERDALRHALERAALSVEHDYDSSACLQRETHQESLRPCQQRPAEHAEDCPACDAQAALSSSPTEEKE